MDSPKKEVNTKLTATSPSKSQDEKKKDCSSPERKQEDSSKAVKRTPLTPDRTRELCAFIKQLCQKLRLKSVTTCSALIFFHRFQAQDPATGIDDYDLATTCVFLACKVEENIQHLETVLNAAYAIQTHESTPLSQNEEKMWKTRERILLCERILLDTMCFNITIQHSHSHAVKFVREIAKGEKFQKFEAEARDLHQTTSNILNDSLSTNMCVKYSADLIGAAAVVLAIRYLKMKSPENPFFAEVLEDLEKNDKILEFDKNLLVKVEDELISTYEVGAFSRKRIKFDSS